MSLAGFDRDNPERCPYDAECGHWAFSEVYGRNMCHQLGSAMRCSVKYHTGRAVDRTGKQPMPIHIDVLSK